MTLKDKILTLMEALELQDYDLNHGIQGVTDINISVADGDMVVCIFYYGEYGQSASYPTVNNNLVEEILPNGVKVKFSLSRVYFALLKELQHRICSLQDVMSQVL